MTVQNIGALLFGLVIGWITYRALRRTKRESSIADISAVIAAVGGGLVATRFDDAILFSWYCIGLALGFFGFLVLALVLGSKDKSVFENGLMGE